MIAVPQRESDEVVGVQWELPGAARQKDLRMDQKKREMGRKKKQKQPPVRDPDRENPPKQHDEAPDRNPAPTRPTRDSDLSGVRRDRGVEGPDDRDVDDH